MARPLDILETMEAVEALHGILLNFPELFPGAFADALILRGTTVEGHETSIANEWASQHYGGIGSNPEAAKHAANALLNAPEHLFELSARARFFLVEKLFPFFDLPPGWRRTAEAAGLRPGHIAAFITTRVEAINSVEDAQREISFIRQILSLPETHGGNVRIPMNREEIEGLQATRYQPIMERHQLRLIADRLWRYAPEEMRKVRDARSMGWRYGPL